MRHNNDKIKKLRQISNDDSTTCAQDENTSITKIIFENTRQYDCSIHHVYICTQDVI